jgi:hypothetical protein
MKTHRYVDFLCLRRTKPMTLSMALFLIGVLALYFLSTSIFKQQDQALAQQYVQWYAPIIGSSHHSRIRRPLKVTMIAYWRYHCKGDFKGLLDVKLSQEPQWSGGTTSFFRRFRFLPMSLFVISMELVHLVTCFEHHCLKIKDLIMVANIGDYFLVLFAKTSMCS